MPPNDATLYTFLQNLLLKFTFGANFITSPYHQLLAQIKNYFKLHINVLRIRRSHISNNLTPSPYFQTDDLQLSVLYALCDLTIHDAVQVALSNQLPVVTVRAKDHRNIAP